MFQYVKEDNIDFRIPILDAILKNLDKFNGEKIAHEFSCALLEEVKAESNDVNSWVLSNLFTIIEFFISNQLVTKEVIMALRSFFKVIVILI